MALDLNTDQVSPEGAPTDVDDVEDDSPESWIGVLAGLEWANTPFADLTQTEKGAIKDLCVKAAKRDYPARLLEIVQVWEASLFYRGFQFLIPMRNGGWSIPGESTGYGPSMQMDLAGLPTNIYSAQGQILISTLTRAVPTVRFEPQEGNDDAAITAAESAEKFIKVIERNNDLMSIQNDACRFLYNDGRFIYWSRFVKDGQRFGWEDEDVPDNIVPENEPPEGKVGDSRIPGVSTQESQEGEEENSPAETPSGRDSETSNSPQGAAVAPPSYQSEAEEPAPKRRRKPRGQEVRTAHGKLEFKLSPIMANDLEGCDTAQYECEVDVSRAKAMFYWIADEIRPGTNGLTEGDIARLARQNVKLGMQATYVTSDSIADDCTIQRTWIRPGYFCHVDNKAIRESLLEKFPDGCLVVYAGEVFCYAVNQAMDDALALGQAFSGDGQNRNALGTSMLPIQKRVNNWLDLLNDSFIRTVPKKWMDSKAFNVDALRKQTNTPGDIGAFKRQPGVQVSELIFVEPQVQVSQTLAVFVKEYIGPISELMSGGYPALSGASDLGGNDTKGGIEIQRNQALGRLGPTWHGIQNAEAVSMRQLVRWGAKCRDKSINEKIPGGRPVILEVNDLKGNILCFPEVDESFPENHVDKQNRLMEIFQDSSKNPQLQEALYNAANLEFLQSVIGLTDLYIEQVASRNKQLGEIEILLGTIPVPNPKLVQGKQKLEQLKAMGVPPEELQQAEQQLEQLPPLVSSEPIDAELDDNETESRTCWQYLMSAEGRKMKKNGRAHYDNVRLHFLEHVKVLLDNQAKNKQHKPATEAINIKDLPPKGAVQLAAQNDINLSESDFEDTEVAKASLKAATKAPRSPVSSGKQLPPPAEPGAGATPAAPGQ
jgi:hypothetical protein